MAQASVLTDTEIRRVFRIIETTRHAERNRFHGRHRLALRKGCVEREIHVAQQAEDLRATRPLDRRRDPRSARPPRARCGDPCAE